MGPSEPDVVGRTSLSALADRRTIRAGDEVRVRIFVDDPLPSFRAYQLLTETSGGRAGSLDLVNITIENRKDSVFQSANDTFEAFNVDNAQMLSGLFTGNVPTKHMRYLATFTYRASKAASGTFVIDVAHDENGGSQTLLVGAKQTDKIEVTGMTPAVVTVTHLGAAVRASPR